jgi:hypothetical protein
LIRCFALGKVTRLLKKYAEKEKISRTGRQLLKGFYTSNKYELNELKVGEKNDDMTIGDINFQSAINLIHKYTEKAKKL